MVARRGIVISVLVTIVCILTGCEASNGTAITTTSRMDTITTDEPTRHSAVDDDPTNDDDNGTTNHRHARCNGDRPRCCIRRKVNGQPHRRQPSAHTSGVRL